MPSLMDVFTQVYLHQPPLIAEKSQKNVKTAIRLLASLYDTIPEKLLFTPAIEAEYRQRLLDYFTEHPKGHSTVRNTLNFIAALWKAHHTIQQTPRVPIQAPRVPTGEMARMRLRDESPYRHLTWISRHTYRVTLAELPAEIRAHWEAFAAVCANEIKSETLGNYRRGFLAYASYLMSPAIDRLSALPGEARETLRAEKYAHWRQQITTTPVLTSWDELFEPTQLNSFITWSAWRCWRWHDDTLKHREPHRPSAIGRDVASIMLNVANRTEHPKREEVYRLVKKLPQFMKMHNKTDPMHQFDLSELEAVAVALMDEARRMTPSHKAKRIKHPGMLVAIRFQLGLILQLAWRNPMRARNWCEATLGRNLRRGDDGQWHWYFEGTELKIKARQGKPNVFAPDVPPEVAGNLDEFLTTYRPLIKNASTDPHVFLSKAGRPMTRDKLLRKLALHVGRYTNKRIYPHLLRSIFSRYHINHGVDINSVAFQMNDTPKAVIEAYNEVEAQSRRFVIADANRAALANGHKPLTPPVIPIIPKPMKTNPDQMNLI